VKLDPAALPYDRARATPGIVHIGLGGFHRAHMARYTHDLMEANPDSLGWGIVGAGLRETDRPLLEALDRQDGLFTLIERDAAEEARTMIGSILRVIDASTSTDALLAQIDDPAIRIVSLTITEHGYCLDPATKQLNVGHPLIAHDLTCPRAPKSAVGVIVEALHRRSEAGLPAFTALSCDNIQHNGAVLSRAVLALAQARDAALAEWIERKARFPSTMVDTSRQAAVISNASKVASLSSCMSLL